MTVTEAVTNSGITPSADYAGIENTELGSCDFKGKNARAGEIQPREKEQSLHRHL